MYALETHSNTLRSSLPLLPPPPAASGKKNFSLNIIDDLRVILEIAFFFLLSLGMRIAGNRTLAIAR